MENISAAQLINHIVQKCMLKHTHAQLRLKYLQFHLWQALKSVFPKHCEDINTKILKEASACMNEDLQTLAYSIQLQRSDDAENIPR